MIALSRHQCLIYDGEPSKVLPSLAVVLQQKLRENYRCFYLNSPSMVTGMRSCLAAAGVDVAREVAKASLVFSSDRQRSVNGQIDVARMIDTIERAIHRALRDGYQGLWATGDLSAELGKVKDLLKLLDYEWRLEELFRKQPGLCGICQYHRDSLPSEIMRQGLLTHPSLFINQTLSRINPDYTRPESFNNPLLLNTDLDETISQLCELHSQSEGNWTITASNAERSS